MKFSKAFISLCVILQCACSPSYAAPIIAGDAFFAVDYVQCAGGKVGHKKCIPGQEFVAASLAQISVLNYQGAFRLPGATYGVSQLKYQERPVIGFNATTGNLLIIGEGDANVETIGGFSIPALVKETGGVFSNLNMAVNTQPFVNVLDQDAVNDNDFSAGRTISGIYEKDGEIIVNYFSYYDSSPWNTDTTVVKRNSANINASTTDTSGSYKMAGATNAGGWISEIPPEWQAALGGTHISGHSSSTTKTINTRHSVGPSAWVFNAADILSPNDPSGGSSIAATAVLDYPIEHHLDIVTQGTLVDARLNEAGTVWNNISEAGYGFIIPGTSTYAVFGGSGGHVGGVDYKPDYDGAGGADALPGHGPIVQGEWDNHYWFYNVNDLVEVKNGTMQSWEPQPYAHGAFIVPFATTNNSTSRVRSATYDKTTGILYMSIAKIDNQGVGSAQPVIVAYTLDGV